MYSLYLLLVWRCFTHELLVLALCWQKLFLLLITTFLLPLFFSTARLLVCIYSISTILNAFLQMKVEIGIPADVPRQILNWQTWNSKGQNPQSGWLIFGGKPPSKLRVFNFVSSLSFYKENRANCNFGWRISAVRILGFNSELEFPPGKMKMGIN